MVVLYLDISVYLGGGLPQQPPPLVSLRNLVMGAVLYAHDPPQGLFSQLLGSSCLTALTHPLSLGIASAKESILVQGHVLFHEQSTLSDRSPTGYKGPALSPQLKTTLKGHPSSRAPVESAEASLRPYHIPVPPSAQPAPSPPLQSLF